MASAHALPVADGRPRGSELPDLATAPRDLPAGLARAGYPDEARRVSDTMNLHVTAGKAGHWAAFALGDGRSDGIAYPTRRAAVLHQLRPEFTMFVPIRPGGATPAEAWALLRFARWAQRNGHRIFDPDDPEPIMPARSEQLAALLRTGRR